MAICRIQIFRRQCPDVCFGAVVRHSIMAALGRLLPDRRLSHISCLWSAAGIANYEVATGLQTAVLGTRVAAIWPVVPTRSTTLRAFADPGGASNRCSKRHVLVIDVARDGGGLDRTASCAGIRQHRVVREVCIGREPEGRAFDEIRHRRTVCYGQGLGLE